MPRQQLPSAVLTGLRRAALADISPYGSIAQRDDPRNYGSIASRTYPGIFGSQMPNQEQADDAQIVKNNRILTLRRQNLELSNPFAADIYQNKQQLLLRRQNQQINPSYPDLGLDDGDGYDD